MMYIHGKSVNQMPIQKPKGKNGGRRPGAGRPPGRRNKATVARELLASQAIAEVMAKLGPADAERLTPLEVMTIAMRVQMQAGDLMAAVSVAERLAPYCHPKVTNSPYVAPVPADLAPDEPACPDEPGPADAE
jgi:hypothetical protein